MFIKKISVVTPDGEHRIMTSRPKADLFNQLYSLPTCPFGKAPGHLGSSDENSFPNPVRYCIAKQLSIKYSEFHTTVAICIK